MTEELFPSGRSTVSVPSDDSVVRGRVTRITFRNNENGYTVFEIQPPDRQMPVVVTGYCASLAVEYEVLAQGKTVMHPKFGAQFAAKSISATGPSSTDGLIRYLSSGVAKGVGTDLATRIVQQFGSETLTIIHQHPERLRDVPGVGEKKAKSLVDSFTDQSAMHQVVQFLIEHQISPSFAHKIYSRYGDGTVAVLQKNPYRLAQDIKGIGFRTADTIATQGLHIPLSSPDRLRAGVVFALESASEEGHCFLPRDSLETKARELLQLGNEIDLTTPIQEALEAGLLSEAPQGVYTTALLQAERDVAAFVQGRADKQAREFIAAPVVNESIAQAQQELRIEFSAQQIEAVQRAACCRMLIITGGPGCGKTTIIRALKTLFVRANLKLLMAAPTGRAAQRMSQVCEHSACTIHRLLHFNPVSGQFDHGSQTPLVADAIIIDESSMIDIRLAQALFSAIPASCSLILVGDKDQLPSVGPGKVFGDLIESCAIPTISLTQLYRRSNESTINTIAHEVNTGIFPHIAAPDGVTKVDAYFVAKSDPTDALTTVQRLVADQLPRQFGFAQSDIMVLTPTNKGPLGTVALNTALQETLNPQRQGRGVELKVGEVVFKVGDRVCQRSNNYTIDPQGVYNGDLGVVSAIIPESKSLEVTLWDGRLIRYPSGDLGQLGLAYAMTVHRAQGSEIPCVVLALHDSHYMLLERQLLYTAVTRAKRFLVIVGSRRALATAVRQTGSKTRHSFLRQMIQP
jgi:exodeoxyribonuclease V alpha subunit